MVAKDEESQLKASLADNNSLYVGKEFEKKKIEFGKTFKLIFCFAGLQCSYLIWGYLQEIVMTKQYVNGQFTSSTVNERLIYDDIILRRSTNFVCVCFSFAYLKTACLL
jgi:hypothetical protein